MGLNANGAHLKSASKSCCHGVKRPNRRSHGSRKNDCSVPIFGLWNIFILKGRKRELKCGLAGTELSLVFGVQQDSKRG